MAFRQLREGPLQRRTDLVCKGKYGEPMESLAQDTSQKVDVLVAVGTRMQCELIAQALIRQGGFQVAGLATQSSEVLLHVRDHQPSVAVIGVDLQDGRRAGLRVLQDLHTLQLKTQGILLLDSPDKELIIAAFRAGAKGVFCRAEPFDLLCKCIESVHAGQVWASKRELHFLLEALADPSPLSVVDAKGEPLLTKREEEVVCLITDGLPNREIAQRLGVSPHTVKNYLYRIFEKLGISSRVELVLYAFAHRRAIPPEENASHGAAAGKNT
jgi:two-component system, NarL family, response regulator DegU